MQDVISQYHLDKKIAIKFIGNSWNNLKIEEYCPPPWFLDFHFPHVYIMEYFSIAFTYVISKNVELKE